MVLTHEVKSTKDRITQSVMQKGNAHLDWLHKVGLLVTSLTMITVYWCIWNDDSQVGGGKNKLILLSLLPLAEVFK